jgi:DNA polymerase-3 subunit delta'
VSALPWHAGLLAELMARRDRMPHALMLHGRPGIGKVELARAIAQSALCESPENNVACGRCAACNWFEQGNHPDFREIVPDAEAQDDEQEEGAEPEAKGEKKSVLIKVDQIRAVMDFMTLSTHRAGFRVLLLHPAEALMAASANALLKTLEEPPPKSLIILVSDQPARLLPTIRSRCLKIAVPVPDAAAARKWLEAQGVENATSTLAQAGGAPLLALELGDADAQAFRRKITDELSRPTGAQVLSYSAGIDRAALEPFLYWMQTWVTDLALARSAGRVRHHLEHGEVLQKIAARCDVDRLFALDDKLREARRLALHPLNPRLLVESLLLAYNRAMRGT